MAAHGRSARCHHSMRSLAQSRSLSVLSCCRERSAGCCLVQTLSTRFALALLRSRSALSQQFVSCVVPSAFCFSLSLSLCHSLILFFLLSIFCTLCLICTFCIYVTHTRFATAFVSFVRSLAHSLACVSASISFTFCFFFLLLRLLCWCCCCCRCCC